MNAASFHTGFGCSVPQTLWVGISKEHLSGLFNLILFFLSQAVISKPRVYVGMGPALVSRCCLH
jgi:hypothetical protein